MPDLEQQLAELNAAIDWPPTPDLATMMARHLPARRGGRAAKRPGWGLSRAHNRWALAAAAVLLILATLLAYTPSRDAIAGWVNLHVFIQRVQQPPTPSPLPSGPLGERLGLGSPTTLDAAQHAVAWQVTVPSSLGPPDEVYLQQPPDGPVLGEVTLVYASRSGIPVSGQTGVSVLITEARGQVNQDFFGKMLGPDTTLEQVTVAGHQGFWIAGRPSVFFFIDANGNVRNETMRLAANTLIFDDNGTVVRIEGDLTKAQALQIAGSMT
jgi:hypothetical protein